MKKELLGRRLRVVLASSYNRDKRFTVAYPLRHGPVVLVQGGQELVGRTAEVIVRRVVSDRLVEGEILRVQGSEIPG